MFKVQTVLKQLTFSLVTIVFFFLKEFFSPEDKLKQRIFS